MDSLRQEVATSDEVRPDPLGLSRWFLDRAERICMLIKGASVPIRVAAELANVEVRTIRQWAAIGALKIEWQGDMEVVRLDKVQQLSGSSWRGSPDARREALRGRLQGVTIDTLSVTGLQQLARERGAG